MIKPNHHCYVCGAGYDFCKHCSIKNLWREVADTEQHYKIHVILEKLRNQTIDTTKAVSELRAIGVNRVEDMGEVLPAVRDLVRDILNDSKPFTLKKSK